MLKPLCIADKRRVDKAKTRGKKSLLTSQPLSVFLMPRKHTAKPLGLTDDLSFFGRRKKQSHLLVYTQVLNMLTKCHFSLYLEKQDKWKQEEMNLKLFLEIKTQRDFNSCSIIFRVLIWRELASIFLLQFTICFNSPLNYLRMMCQW